MIFIKSEKLVFGLVRAHLVLVRQNRRLRRHQSRIISRRLISRRLIISRRIITRRLHTLLSHHTLSIMQSGGMLK